VTTTPARALLQRLGRFLDGFSACFSRRPQREAASRYLDGLFNDGGGSPATGDAWSLE
jgi:hypothetical protein